MKRWKHLLGGLFLGLFLAAAIAPEAGVRDYSTTAGSNASVSSQNWAEGMAPSAVNDSARKLLADLAELYELQGGILSTGGTANAQTLTPTVAWTAYTNGDRVLARVGAGLTNTASTTLNVSALGTKTIYLSDGSTALSGGELQAGKIVELVYDSTASGFRLLTGGAGSFSSLQVNQSSAISQAFHAGAAKVQIAGGTNTAVAQAIEYQAGAAGLGGGAFVVGKSRNATIGSHTIVQADERIGSFAVVASDGTALLQAATISAFVDGTPGTNDMPTRLVFSVTPDGSATPGEALRISADKSIYHAGTGNKLIDGATSKIPVARFTRFTSSGQTIAAGTTLTLAHSLGAAPFMVQLAIKMGASTELGYAADDEVLVNFNDVGSSGSDGGFAVYSDATNVNIVMSTVVDIVIPHKTTRILGTIDKTKWTLIARASL